MRIALEIVPARRSVDSGYGRYMYALAGALIRQPGAHSLLVVLGRNGNESLIPAAPNAALARCPVKNQNINQQWFAARAARRWNADVLHNTGAPASLLWNRKLILTIHDVASVRFPELFPKRWSAYQKYAYAYLKKKNPLVVTVSEFSKREIVEYFRFPAERIRVVPPVPGFQPRAVSPDEIAAVRGKYALPETFFLFVGLIEPRKNLLRLVDAFEEYCAAEHDGIALVIAGKIGWHAQPLMEKIRASAAGARIYLPGYIEDSDLPALMSAARAFVFPSLYEGFGYPPLEALMLDTPVLTSNCASLPAAVGDAGLLVDPLDVHAIAGGMARIAGDETLRARLIANGKRHRAQFTPENTARQILALYDEL